MNREELATKYITGNGIEIGALHFPTKLPAGVTVTYVDRDPALVRREHSDVVPAVKDWIVDDAEKLSSFKNESLDFVIANHVLEHLWLPIRALTRFWQVLKPGGTVMCALPEKTKTFDRDRQITTNIDLLFRHEHNDKRSHYDDWFRNGPDKISGETLQRAIELAIKEDRNIHFNVWDHNAMSRLFLLYWTRGAFYDYWNGAEVIWILKKTKERQKQ